MVKIGKSLNSKKMREYFNFLGLEIVVIGLDTSKNIATHCGVIITFGNSNVVTFDSFELEQIKAKANWLE